MAFLRDLARFLPVVVFGAVGAILPLTGGYLFWAWIMDQVPLTIEWAGLLKVGLTLLLIPLGGTVTCALAFVLGMLGALVGTAISARFD